VKTVNELQVRNNLGKILQDLEESGEPILLSKGRKVQAAIITIEDFQRRFLDRQAEEAKAKWLGALRELSAPRIGRRTSLEILRELRGYPK
jgi:hypothetical protein